MDLSQNTDYYMGYLSYLNFTVAWYKYEIWCLALIDKHGFSEIRDSLLKRKNILCGSKKI